MRALYARFGNLIHEGARFGVVGFIGLVVTDGVTNLLRYQAGLDRLSSFAIASVIAAGVTFIEDYLKLFTSMIVDVGIRRSARWNEITTGSFG